MYLIHGSVLLASLGFIPTLTAGETIGTVVTPGRILVNNLAVEGNATLTNGALLKTSSAPARVDLISGGAVSLDVRSEALASRLQMQLRHGKGILTNAAATIEALGLKVKTADAQSQVLVTVAGDKVEVAAIRGMARVQNRQGMLLALVHNGKPLSFEPGLGPPESTVTGTLRREGAKLLLQDELTGTCVELRGDGLAAQQGQRIQASGESQITGDTANHVILVSRLNRLESEPASGNSASSPSTANTTASTAAKTGMSAGTKIGLAALAFGGIAAGIAVPLAMSN